MNLLKFHRENRPHRRVVVTGLGAVTPLGVTLDESWQNALRGTSGIGPITRFDASKFDARIAGEIKNFPADLFISKKEQRKLELFSQYAVAASKMALDSSGLLTGPTLDEALSLRTGVFIGVGMGGLATIEEQHQQYFEKGPSRISPFFVPLTITNIASGHISIMFNLKGPNYTVTSACASGAHSIGEAANYIRLGLCDVMLAGGSESTVCPLGVGGFAAMRALSTRNDDPTRASRPFDSDRDGFVLAEGAATLVLEDYEHAVKRGANILCEITGYGASGDANHITNPAPGGAGAAHAIRVALKDAGLNPEDISYVNAHGTSTPVGDKMETMAIKSALGDHSKKVWVSSTKSMTGHTLGAAGAIEAAFCIMSIKDQCVAPTINLDSPSEGCDLDYVPKEARQGRIQHTLNNSFGFGGTNACVIFSKI